MQRDPSGMDPNRDRPSSPASGDNAPSPSKRQRLDGAAFNPNQPGAMMPNGGRPVQGMPGQQMANANPTTAATQLLVQNGINPSSLNAQQFENFVNAPPAAQYKSIATYSQNLQQHHGNQLGNKQLANAGAPQNQGSPMMAQGPDGNALNAFYNPGDLSAGPGGLRPGPPNGAQGGTGSNHALQDYQMQLMLLEQQNKKRLMMARQEQDLGGMPREGPPGAQGPPGAPGGPNSQFPDTSPQGMRTGTSPNPAEQMKRGTPQMNNSGISSPVPENGQSRGSPNAPMNFAHVDPNMQHFNMATPAQMNGMRPANGPQGQPFNSQLNAQQMMMRQQQAQQAQQVQQAQQANWQPGANGQIGPQGMQQNPQVQGTPQQRSMPPPSAPAAAAANANAKTTASPQQGAAAPPTPNQTNKSAPKKSNAKSAKDKVCTEIRYGAGPLNLRVLIRLYSVLPQRSLIRTSTPLPLPLRPRLATTAESRTLRHQPLQSLLPTLATLTRVRTTTAHRMLSRPLHQPQFPPPPFLLRQRPCRSQTRTRTIRWSWITLEIW